MKNRMKIIVTLTGLVTASLYLINRIQYSLSTSKNILNSEIETISGSFYEWRFGKIHYTKKGSGSPLLLIHNLTLGSSNYEFHKIINELSNTHEVYAIDLLGYGLSEKPNMTYTNYLYVQLIIDFIKNVIGKKTDVIATGDSAPIIFMACHNDPEVFERLTFISPQNLYHLNQIPSKHTKLFKLLLEAPILGTFIYNILSSRNMIEEDFKEKYFFRKEKIEKEDIDAYVEAAHLPGFNSKYVFASYIGKYMNANIIHSLKEINHSIFLIGGKESKDCHTILENYQYYNNSIETHELEGAKLLPHLEIPEELLEQLQIYLQ